METQNNNLGKVNQQKSPKYLYKYFSINKYTRSVFVNNEIYFCKPSQFNDPFDSKVCYKFEGKQITKLHFIRKQLKQLPSCSKKQAKQILSDPKNFIEFERNMQKLWDDSRNQLGVLCLSEKNDNILMWSHYSQQHQGFCLEFNPKLGFLQRAHPIVYSQKLPIFNPLHYKETRQQKLTLAKDLLTKSSDWKYEQEWRVINLPEHGGPGVHELHEKALTGVIFGFRMSEENKEQIITWCDIRKHKPNFYITRPKKEEYGLDIVPLNI